MNPREEFLRALFRILESKAVPYCVLRNYQNIYDDTSTDVDLAAEPEHVQRLQECLAEAAAASQHRFIHRARYINYSFVYWHSEGGFVRIDIDTEIRWRTFPVLTAKSIIGLRRKAGAFYIPHPRHESVGLLVAAIWRGYLSERYRERLSQLYRQVADPEEWERTFRSVFGKAGEELAGRQARILEQENTSRLWKTARRSIIRNAFRDSPNRRALLGYLARDAQRLWERLRHPAGIALVFASRAETSDQMDRVVKQMEFLYPTKKSAGHSFNVLTRQGSPPRLDLGAILERLHTLFKGGLFLRCYQVQHDRELRKAIAWDARFLYPSRTFVCAETSRQQTCLAHVESGFMADFNLVDGASDSNNRIVQFITRILEQHRPPRKRRLAKRGTFVVLVGLDGSGKTTVARKLCCLAGEQNHFQQARYFHWQPRLFRRNVFPLPDFDIVPRKPKLTSSAWRSILSVARLFKNVVLTNLAHGLRLRPLLRKNSLVLVDRYFYNYFLDPVSVKYYGPSWLLDRMRPFFPQPDLVVILKAPQEVLLARKQELREEEVRRQSAQLELVRFDAPHTLAVDASRPPQEVAASVMQKIVEISSCQPN